MVNTLKYDVLKSSLLILLLTSIVTKKINNPLFLKIGIIIILICSLIVSVGISISHIQINETNWRLGLRITFVLLFVIFSLSSVGHKFKLALTNDYNRNTRYMNN